MTLQIHGLCKAFGTRSVLTGVDLEIGAGEFVAVLGANGSGKSTALRCVVGLERPDAGTIRVDGAEARRGVTAMVFQRIHLVARRSALDNVCAGALGRLPLHRSLTPMLFPGDLRTEAMACLERVGLADCAEQQARRLSGGQQQRVAIARALCQRTNVLLADEPVSSLDPRSATQVMTLLHDLAADGLAVAAVLHQPKLALRHADRIAGLLHGTIVVNGPAGQIGDEEIDALYEPERVVA